MDISKVAIGKSPPEEVNVIIEVSLRSDPIKYEFDKDSGAIMVDRFLYTTMFYPCNYGFIPHTLAEDGDPVDVMVIGRMPVQPGAVLAARDLVAANTELGVNGGGDATVQSTERLSFRANAGATVRYVDTGAEIQQDANRYAVVEVLDR